MLLGVKRQCFLISSGPSLLAQSCTNVFPEPSLGLATEVVRRETCHIFTRAHLRLFFFIQSLVFSHFEFKMFCSWKDLGIGLLNWMRDRLINLPFDSSLWSSLRCWKMICRVFPEPFIWLLKNDLQSLSQAIYLRLCNVLNIALFKLKYLTLISLALITGNKTDSCS